MEPAFESGRGKALAFIESLPPGPLRHEPSLRLAEILSHRGDPAAAVALLHAQKVPLTDHDAWKSTAWAWAEKDAGEMMAAIQSQPGLMPTAALGCALATLVHISPDRIPDWVTALPPATSAELHGPALLLLAGILPAGPLKEKVMAILASSRPQ